MAERFRLNLYTGVNLAQQEELVRFWEFLSDSGAQPSRYDSVERTRRVFSRDAAQDARELYERDRFLFVRGRRDGLLATLAPQPGGLATWDFAFNLAGRKVNQGWLDWILALLREFPALFGNGCTQSEWDAKHVAVESVGGGTVTRTVGVSMRAFRDYLPGLYWLTAFGSDLVEYLGRDTLEGLEGVAIFDPGGGQVVVRLDEPVVPEDMEARLEQERALARALDPRLFFDRAAADMEYAQAPSLLRKLDRLEAST